MNVYSQFHCNNPPVSCAPRSCSKLQADKINMSHRRLNESLQHGSTWKLESQRDSEGRAETLLHAHDDKVGVGSLHKPNLSSSKIHVVKIQKKCGLDPDYCHFYIYIEVEHT